MKAKKNRRKRRVSEWGRKGKENEEGHVRKGRGRQWKGQRSLILSGAPPGVSAGKQLDMGEDTGVPSTVGTRRLTQPCQ